MITEPLEEQASLYVLGLLCRDEEAAFEALVAKDPELSALVASLNNATIALARSYEAYSPPSDVKTRLMTSITEPKVAPIVPFPPPRKKTSLLLQIVPWTLAATFAAMGAMFYREAMDANKRVVQSVDQEKAVTGFLSGKVDEERSKGVVLKSQVEELVKKLDVLTSTSKDLESKLASAEIAKVALGEQIEELKKSSDLDQARIAVMSSLLKSNPKAVAVSIWNQQNQDGVLVVENLPALSPGKDYQLWVIDKDVAAPISAGVFKVDAQGNYRLSFKPAAAVKAPAKFAITEEKEGGVASPTMDKMVVIGG